MTKTINLTFYADQIAYDLLENCNLIKNLLKEGLTEDLKASIESPDSDETKALICRATTEAWGRVKYLCQRYLRSGRTEDSNTLERLCHKVLVPIAQPMTTEELQGNASQNPTGTEGATERAREELPGGSHDIEDEPVDAFEEKIVWEELKLTLHIPNFNTAVTDALKSAIHKYITDYITSRFLQNLAPEKSAEYKALADGDSGDADQIVIYLNTREVFTRRTPSFF